MKRAKMNVVYGGQAGSEAKGKQAAFLADKFGIKIFACNLSPNAGHTVLLDDGRKVVTHHIPVGVAGCTVPERARVVIGPAAIINIEKLKYEVENLKTMGILDPQNITIDSRASVIDDEAIKEEEKTMLKIGSTAQGVGITRSRRIMRNDVKIRDFASTIRMWGLKVQPDTTSYVMNLMDMMDETVLYEMGQGFDLCLDHGVDPRYCTSRNCTPMQALADMGIPVQMLGHTYAVIRTYPIRVNNREGSSGPYPSNEITWGEVRNRCGAPDDITEITTTTKLVRRVFEFSWQQIGKMMDVCRPDFLCVQFANYLDWGIYEQKKMKSTKVESFVNVLDALYEKNEKPIIGYVGTGPKHSHMIDRGIDNYE